MRLALAWLVGTALFGLGLVLVDRWFWAQCSGLPTGRYGEVWICVNSPYVRLALVCLAGFIAGLLARRRALAVGGLTGLAGVALVSFAYRPLVPFTQAAGLLAGVAYFVAPTMLAALLAALLLRKRPS